MEKSGKYRTISVNTLPHDGAVNNDIPKAKDPSESSKRVFQAKVPSKRIQAKDASERSK